MSTKKHGILAKPLQWAKHLRPFTKRRQAKAERQAGKKIINQHKS